MPTTYFLIAILAEIAMHLTIPIVSVIHRPWSLAGVLFLACGVWLNLSADQSFKHENTTVKPFQESSTLVTAGVFQYTRNPIYLGFVLILLGEAILLGSISPFIVVAIFPVLIVRVFIRVEEQMLAERFADRWREYATRVGRWL
jgi:protein-S-isoprenylcysteine O-methyltransferase Ste14